MSEDEPSLFGTENQALFNQLKTDADAIIEKSHDLKGGQRVILHLAFRKSVEEHRPVGFYIRGCLYSYEYKPEHTSFADGVELQKVYSGISSENEHVYNTFDLDAAKKEGRYTQDENGNLTISRLNKLTRFAQDRFKTMGRMRQNHR